MNKEQYYFLAQDDDCHWYLVENDHRTEWDDWRNDPKSWRVPKFAKELGSGPSSVIFTNPKEL